MAMENTRKSVRPFYIKDPADFYSFVLSSLANESRKEHKKIILGDIAETKMLIDICFPDGLSILGNNHNKPYYVEISRDFNNDKFSKIKRKLDDIGFKGTFFYICQEAWIIDEDYNYWPFESVVLGQQFVNELKERNYDAYLNYAIGNKKSVLKSDVENKQHRKTLSESYLLLNDEFNDELLLKEEDPERISNLNENEFKSFLKSNEQRSNCAVFIGNGVSIPFGSDNWSTMIQNLVDILAPYYVENAKNVENTLSNSSYALASFVKTVIEREESTDKYIKAIRYCIYRKYNEMMHDQFTLVKVLAMAKAKYKTLPLLTYNYDTFVERQYYHDYHRDLSYFSNDYKVDDLDAIARNNIIHLHGYISYLKNKYSQIVLTDYDYFNTYFDKYGWAYKTQINVLSNYVCLFVGSSMSDLFQMSLIQNARKHSEKWNCFALMCFNNLGFKEKIQIIKYYKEKGIRIIFVNSFEELPIKLKNLFNL